MDQSVNTPDFNSPEYKRSRVAYTFDCAFEYFVALLVSGSFLATLLSYLGMSDALIGIISSFISLSFLFQLFSVFVVQKIANTKRFVTVFHFLSQIFFMSLYLVPFLPFGYKQKEILIILCILAAYFGNYFVTSMIYQWGNSYVKPTGRARFSATKEMISLACGMAVTLVAGYVMDIFEMADDLEGGFIFCAISIFIFSLSDLVCLMLIKNRIKTTEEMRTKTPLKEVLKNTLGNKNYINITILQILWDVGRYFTTGFLATYAINAHELNFSMSAVQIILAVANLGRFFASRPFGRFSDKYSFAKGIELGLILAALSFGVSVFMTPETRYLYLVFCLLNHVCLAGISQNLLNITYNFVDSKYVAEAMAIKNSLGGICGFGASLIGSALLTHIQENGNTLFGLHIYGQQFLSIISFIILTAAVIFTKAVIQKQKAMIQ